MNKVKKFFKNIFGGIEMGWKRVVVFAVAMGIYTALMAILVPDGNSLHDIVATMEWWVLPAILIITNCKKPLEAAEKTFMFFLISQPIIYLLQVPFSEMGWGLFGYYPYWFKITLLTFPAAYIGWYMKKDKWYSGLILSVATTLLVFIGVSYARGFSDSFPNHLLSTIYCFGIVPVFILGIFQNKTPRIITTVISLVVLMTTVVATNHGEPYEVYNSTFLQEEDIVFVDEPIVTFWSGTGARGEVEVIKIQGEENAYTLKLSGYRDAKYQFDLSDSENEYQFEYHYDDEAQAVVINWRK